MRKDDYELTVTGLLGWLYQHTDDPIVVVWLAEKTLPQEEFQEFLATVDTVAECRKVDERLKDYREVFGD